MKDWNCTQKKKRVSPNVDGHNHLMSSAGIIPETYQDSSSLTWSPGLSHCPPVPCRLPSKQKYTASVPQPSDYLNVSSVSRELPHTCISQMLDLVSSGISAMFLFWNVKKWKSIRKQVGDQSAVALVQTAVQRLYYCVLGRSQIPVGFDWQL